MMSRKASISTVIPTLNGEKHLTRLLPRLLDQTHPIDEILVIDSSSTDGTVRLAEEHGARTHIIRREAFNHGGTRNLGVEMARGDIVLFLSQDVLPLDDTFVANLTRNLRANGVAAAYARQLPGSHAIPTERFLRASNYPPVGEVRSSDHIATMGLSAFFFSNAASAVRRPDFLEVGGFPTNVILSEDMILCSRMLRAGHQVEYAADALVEHTHNYNLRQQFRRYFDIGAAYQMARDEIGSGASTGKGLEFAKNQIRWMWNNGHRRWIPFGATESGTKFLAYRLGRAHRWIPYALKRTISMHPRFWQP